MTVADLGLSRQGGEGVLVCPACGEDGLLMISATTVWSEQGREAEALMVHVDMDGMRCAQKKRAEHDIIVMILLHCDDCSKEMSLQVAERDGQTMLEVWR